jgi:MoaA/NifB/PqqE/SkfB family radical SAM enzyme
VFCAYPKLRRRSETMSLELFEKIVREYAEMGGGALLLTPIVGDFFLDKHWRERVAIARRHCAIGMISVTTNAIALSKVPDRDIEEFLRDTDFMQVSIGGASREAYRAMFGVDRYDRVKSNVIRLSTIRDRVAPDYPIRIGYRVASKEEVLASKDYALFRSLGFEIVVETEFGNWGGLVEQSDLIPGARLRAVPSIADKRNPCFVFFLGLFVAASGKVTVCGCMDAELQAVIGDCRRQTIAEIWHGAAYHTVKASFGSERMPDICKRCSFYEDGVVFSRSPEAMQFQSGQYPLGRLGRHVMFERAGVYHEGDGE